MSAPPHVRLGVPFIKQKGNWCGPAALAMVLRFHGREITQEQIAAKVATPKNAGALNLDLKLFAREMGFQAESGRGSLGDVKAELAGGRPVICTIRLRRGLHYAPLVGYDDSRKCLMMHLDKPFAEMSYDEFARRWKAGDYWMLRISPRK